MFVFQMAFFFRAKQEALENDNRDFWRWSKVYKGTLSKHCLVKRQFIGCSEWCKSIDLYRNISLLFSFGMWCVITPDFLSGSRNGKPKSWKETRWQNLVPLQIFNGNNNLSCSDCSFHLCKLSHWWPAVLKSKLRCCAYQWCLTNPIILSHIYLFSSCVYFRMVAWELLKRKSGVLPWCSHSFRCSLRLFVCLNIVRI